MHQATRRLNTVLQQTVVMAAVSSREGRVMCRSRAAKLRRRIVRTTAARQLLTGRVAARQGNPRPRPMHQVQKLASPSKLLLALQRRLARKYGPEPAGRIRLLLPQAVSITAAARMNGRVPKASGNLAEGLVGDVHWGDRRGAGLRAMRGREHAR